MEFNGVVLTMALQIDQVRSQVDVHPSAAPAQPAAAPIDGVDRATLGRLRPIVLQILKEELEKLRRQQG